MSPERFEGVLGEIRQCARRADWTAVRGYAEHEVVRLTSEGALLVSEAELRQGDSAAARERLAVLVAEAARRHDAVATRLATNMLGAAHFELGEMEAAETAFEASLTAAGREQDHLTAARATNNLGMIANLRGRHELALTRYRMAVPAYQRLGATGDLAGVFHNLAITLRDLGQLDAADDHERRAMEYAEEAGNERVLAIARAGRGEISLRTGEYAVAAASAARAAGALEALGDPLSAADALRIMALAEANLGRPERAADAIDNAVTIAEEVGAALIHAECLRARAEIRLKAGDRAGALADVGQAARAFRDLGATPELAAVEAWWSAANH
ncbi:MAG: tetratricopeptide repeat protein [Gemmatimonadales bacterium]